MQIKCYTFSKRKNSTKQPAGTDGVIRTVTLKNPTSVVNPVFVMDTAGSNVNYIYCAELGRYYFVTDAIWINKEICELHCAVDVLASYKTQIGNTAANVEYCASSGNIKITDPRNKPTFDTVEKKTTLGSLTTMGFSDVGCFIVGIASNQGLNYYKMNESEFRDLCQNLFNISHAQALSNQFFDLASCIVSAVWSAYVPDASILSLTPVTIGGDTTSEPQIASLELGSFWRITRRLDSFSFGQKSIAFPSGDHGLSFNYLDMAPFTSGVLYLPFVGCVPLDLDVYAPGRAIRIKGAIDHYTGDITYILSNADGDVISTYQGNCATNIPVSGQSYNAIGKVASGLSALGGLASIAAGVVTKNVGAVGAGVGALANAALSNYQSGQMHTHTNGSLSSAVSAKLSLDLIASVITRVPSTWSINTEYKNISGMPYFKTAVINTLSGYVQCNEASVDITGTSGEKDAVNGYVNSGFYYE